MYCLESVDNKLSDTIQINLPFKYFKKHLFVFQYLRKIEIRFFFEFIVLRMLEVQEIN